MTVCINGKCEEVLYEYEIEDIPMFWFYNPYRDPDEEEIRKEKEMEKR
ncbi:MAG: hypothetical protein QW046_06045 [Candidatus Micrarchaeaceae archaeon]